MKKDIKCLKEELNHMHRMRDPDRNPDEWFISKTELLEAISKLSEPEVLSQEWIDEHKVARINNLRKMTMSNVVPVDDLQNLLVPKQEITYEDALKIIAENIDTDKFSVGLYIEALNNNEKYEFLTDKWIHEHAKAVTYDGIPDETEIVYVDDLENLIIPKQELPVIPRYVGEFIEEAKGSGDTLDDAFSILTGIYYQSEAADWLAKEKRNSEIFARAWLDGYTVEEEPLYYALIKCNELITDEGDWTCKYWKFDTSGGYVSPSNRFSTHDRFLIEMSKSEWNKLGINDSNADFVEVEELENE